MVQIIWEFTVHKDKTTEFEQFYGKNGTWAQLFKSDRGYKKTELIVKDYENQIYVTIDTWKTFEQYEQFLKVNNKVYKQLEQKTKSFFISKEEIGIFSEE